MSALRRSRFRGLLLWVIAIAVALIAWLMLVSVRHVTPDEYRTFATDLRASPSQRFGYRRLYHGVELVRTANVEAAGPFDAPAPDDKTAARLNRQLAWMPAEAAGELALYIVVAAWIHFGRRRLDGWLASGRRLGGVASTAALLAGAWLILLLPYLGWHYGSWVARAWPAPEGLFWEPTIGSGFTVTYRLVLGGLAMAPALLASGAAALTGTPDGVDPNSPTLLLVFGLLFWAAYGALWGALSPEPRRKAETVISEPLVDGAPVSSRNRQRPVGE